MVVAVMRVHAGNGFLMNWTGQQKGAGFEYHLAMAIAVAVIIGGGGAASLDRGLSTRR